MIDNQSDGLTLRRLPLPTRIVLAAFLLTMGFGYFAGLVQLHFAHAKKGELLPGAKEVEDIYHGPTGQPISKIEQLLTAADGPFSGAGTMRPAFFELYDSGSSGKLEQKRKEWEKEKQANPQLEKEREGELLAVIEWVRNGANKKTFDENKFQVSPELAQKPITEAYLAADDNNKPVQPRAVKIQEIIKDRCMRCHTAGGGAADQKAKRFPLDTYEQIARHATVQSGSARSLDSLALTTHVHLLAFGMMFMLTGVIFSLTSYPMAVRTAIAPLALIAQVVDIGCWWLGRLDPAFAQIVFVTGGIVAVSLIAQIVGSLFNMFDKAGKAIVFVILLGAGALAYGAATRYVLPYLEQEKGNAVQQK